MENKLIFNRGTDNEMTLRGKDIISVTLTETFNSQDGITMGAACSNKLTADIIVLPGLSLAASDVEAYAIKDGMEYPLGKFYVCDVETVNGYKTASVECYDKFCKAEEIYVPGVKPVEAKTPLNAAEKEKGDGESLEPEISPEYSVKDILEEIADNLNAEVAFDFTPYEALTVADIEGYTYRQMLGYIAGLLGKNACFDRNGRIDFKWYGVSEAVITREEQYQNQFNLIAGGKTHISSLTSGSEERVISAGEGRGLSFENPFMTEERLSAILEEMGDFSFQPCSVSFRGNMAIHAGDRVQVEDETGNMIDICVMEQTISFNGGMYAQIQCYGQSEESYSFEASTSSAVIGSLKRRLEKTVKMGNEIKGSDGGYFQIIDLDGDGVSDTFVLRAGSGEGDLVFGNKNGIGFSRDGGKTLTTAINQEGICTEALHADQLWGTAFLKALRLRICFGPIKTRMAKSFWSWVQIIMQSCSELKTTEFIFITEALKIKTPVQSAI